MRSKILINATQKEELRVAIIKDNKLDDLDIERIGIEQRKANIYKGIITRTEPSLGAAFVNFGADRHGFLPLKEIDKMYFVQEPSDSLSRINIRDVLKEGQELIVQVDKEERGTKGAALTTFISLAGSYLVLMPNNPRAGGISRRIEGDERDELREILGKLVIPEDMGVIVRTAGVGKTLEELQWDLNALLHYWQTVINASKEREAPFLIHRESDVVIRSVRDYLRPDISDIIVDTPEVYTTITEYLQQIRPEFVSKVQLHQDKATLFSHYQIEKQIEAAYQREVTLHSGGSIVIDHTEALVSIDVNSARSTSGRDIEETAFNTNMEAAEEIARQLRIRDIGGLIVIDFIDMISSQNQREISNRLRDALQFDRARVRIGNITKFGLMEMSRQRIRPPLLEAIQTTCPRCDGQGTIRSTSSLALSIIRLLEEDASLENTSQVHAHVPIDLATYMLNEKRDVIAAIERRHEVRILVIPNPYIKTPKYKIKRFRNNELGRGEREIESYRLIEPPKIETPIIETPKVTTSFEEPAVKQPLPQTPAPTTKKKNGGLINKILNLFRRPKITKKLPENKNKPETHRHTTKNRPLFNRPRRNYSRHHYSNRPKKSNP